MICLYKVASAKFYKIMTLYLILLKCETKDIISSHSREAREFQELILKAKMPFELLWFLSFLRNCKFKKMTTKCAFGANNVFHVQPFEFNSLIQSDDLSDKLSLALNERAVVQFIHQRSKDRQSVGVFPETTQNVKHAGRTEGIVKRDFLDSIRLEQYRNSRELNTMDAESTTYTKERDFSTPPSSRNKQISGDDVRYRYQTLERLKRQSIQIPGNDNEEGKDRYRRLIRRETLTVEQDMGNNTHNGNNETEGQETGQLLQEEGTAEEETEPETGPNVVGKANETIVSAAEGMAEGTIEPETEGTAEGTIEPETEGTAEGTVEPETEGTAERTIEPETEGAAEGTIEPETEGAAEGTIEPETEGTAEPEGGGTAKGTVEPETEGTAEGTIEPETEGAAEGTIEPETEGTAEGTIEPETEGAAEGTAEPEATETAEGTIEPETEGEGEDETGPEAEAHAEAIAEPKAESDLETEAEPGSETEPYDEPNAESDGEPEAEGEAEVEAEGEAEGEAQAESNVWPEPNPDWEEAFQRWKHAWPFHIIFFSALFIIVSLIAVLVVVCAIIERGWRRCSKSVIALSALVFSFTSTRVMFLCTDAYGHSGDVNILYTRIVFSFGLPGYTAAFMNLLLIILDTTKATTGPPRFLKLSFIFGLYAVHLAAVVITDVLVFAISGWANILLFLCQLFFILYGLAASFGFFYAERILHRNLAASKNAKDPLHTRLVLLRFLSISSGCVAICVAGINLYMAVGDMGVFANDSYVDAWEWWITQTMLRLLEALASFMVLLAFMNTAKASALRAMLCERWKIFRRCGTGNQVGQDGTIAPDHITGQTQMTMSSTEPGLTTVGSDTQTLHLTREKSIGQPGMTSVNV